MKKILSFIICLQISLLMYAQEPIYTKFYYSDSSVSSEGWMLNGKPDGYWKTYYENGVLRSQGNRLNYQLDSTWFFYSTEGEIQMEIRYKEGRKNGIRKIYTDEKIIETFFRDYTIQNIEKYYDKEGNLRLTIPYENGLMQGYAKEYDKAKNIIAVTEYNKGYIIKKENINKIDRYQMKQGSWKTFWDNGNLQMEGYYINNKKNGFFKYYNEEGVFLQIEKWKNDELITDAIETKQLEKRTAYHPNGRIKTEAFYFNDKAEGIRREYDMNGNVVQSYIFKSDALIGEGIVDENGWKQGEWKEFYEESGELKAKGKYKDNKAVGYWEYYFPEGNIELKGEYTQQGNKDGEWIWYYPDNKILMIENYYNGNYDGKVFSLNEKGDTLFSGNYDDGLENGKFMYKNDSVIEEHYYMNGLKHGNWKIYYPNGKLKETAHFDNDLQEGKTISYWENGRKKSKYNYTGGLLNGKSYIYDEEGNHLFSTTYNMGIETEYGNVKVKPVLEK